MALFTVKPTELDKAVARSIAVHTDEPVEIAARMLTWAADEHVLVAGAALGWLVMRRSSEPARRFSNHLLACSLVTAILPHVLKAFVDQKRPDRCVVHGRRRGIPFSGLANDAFPSGHALHVGALCSAATLLPSGIRNAVLATGVILVSTRIVVLAHWVTDVLAGLALGVVSERMLRKLTDPTPLCCDRSDIATSA